MSESCPIQALYLRQISHVSELAELSLLEEQVSSLIKQQEISLDELLEHCVWKETLMSPEKTLENWKSLLAVNLLNHLSTAPSKKIHQLVHDFERHPWNQSSQLFRLLVALNHLIAKMPVPEVGVHLLESGAAPIDFQEYCPWHSLPYHPYHLEFGIFLTLFGMLSKKSTIEVLVRRLSSWQLNTLDAKGFPFAGLYIRENDSNYFELVMLHYLLFRGAASLLNDTKLHYFSQVLAKHLQEIFKEPQTPIHPLWVLIEKKFDGSFGKSATFELPVQIHDSSNSLIGYRTEQNTAVCTLHGDHTGLGYLRQDDVEIVNYGPQYIPLDDCKGFGIEGNHLSDHGIRQSIMEWQRHGFSLKGCVRVVDQPLGDIRQAELYRSIWMEIVQEYKVSHMHLKATLLGLDGWDGVGFSFFIKAQACQVSSDITLLPGKLERYDGSIMPIKLTGSQSAMELSAHTPKGKMQVIPLCGGNNFWGANFLIAYLLDSDQRDYAWTIQKVLSEVN